MNILKMRMLYKVSNPKTGTSDLVEVNDVSEISALVWPEIKFLRMVA